MFTIILLILLKKLKHYKRLVNSIELVIRELDDNTLNKINRKCEAYITATIDNKQVNSVNKIKTKQKEFAFLRDKVQMQLVLNQFELNANDKKCDVIKSTFEAPTGTVEGEPTPEAQKKSNKKEKKA